MRFFGRKKSAQDDVPSAESTAGIAPDALATGDFEIVVRALVAQMSGDTVTELGNDAISAGGHQHYLGNLRGGWNQRPEGEREVWLRNAIYGFHKSELRNMDELDTSMLRPGIRSQWTANLTMLMSQQQNPDAGPDPTARVAFRPMADGIVRVLIWDTPTTMSLINEHQLDEWGRDFDTLWDVAVMNLTNDPTMNGWAAMDRKVWQSLDADDYTAERIFVDGHLKNTGLEGDVVMFHPHRSLLILTDPNDPEAIEMAADLVRGQLDKPNPVSTTPIVGRGLHWRPLVLEPGHPASQSVDYLRLYEQTMVYAPQQEMLSSIHGDELFVASFKAYGAPDGTIISVTTWTEGCDALLPKAQNVAFVSDLDAAQPDVFQVSWAHAQELVGHRMEPTAHYPERVRVVSFPDAAELAALKQHAIPN